MDSLYKTLPKRYVSSLLEGEILFRNMVYFITIEGDPRADIYEGRHVDRPDHPIRVKVVATGETIEGDFGYHNIIKHPERIFCFCTSMQHHASHSKFGDACVEIFNPALFTKRLGTALVRRSRLTRLDTPVLIARSVSYYRVNEAAPSSANIKNPKDLAFLKRETYSDEYEYRFVFARRGGYELLQQLVTPEHDVLGALAGKPEGEILIMMGSIRDIAREIFK